MFSSSEDEYEFNQKYTSNETNENKIEKNPLYLKNPNIMKKILEVHR